MPLGGLTSTLLRGAELHRWEVWQMQVARHEKVIAVMLDLSDAMKEAQAVE